MANLFRQQLPMLASERLKRRLPNPGIATPLLTIVLFYVSLGLCPESLFWRFACYWWVTNVCMNLLQAGVRGFDLFLLPWGGCGLLVSLTLLPILAGSLGLWLGWSAPIIISGIACIVIGGHGWWMRNKLVHEIANVNSLQHPLGEGSEWMIAVSRRFSSSSAVEVYQSAIRPILERHGCVVECRYAAEAEESADFWLNRMRLILELSDIHVLIEHDISSRVFVEHLSSLSILMARKPRALMCEAIFGEDHPLSNIRPGPLVVVITPNAKKFFYRINFRCAVVPLVCSNSSLSCDAPFLEEALEELKRIKLVNYSSAAMERLGWKKFSDRVVSPNDRKIINKARSARQEWAEVLADEERIEEYRKVLEGAGTDTVGKSALMAYICNVLDGKVTLPRSFWSRYWLIQKLIIASVDSSLVWMPVIGHLLLGRQIAALAIALPGLSRRTWASSHVKDGEPV